MWTPKKLADLLTKGIFTRDEWNHLLRLLLIMSFSMFSCSHFSHFLSDPIGMQSAMSKRGQEATSSEGSPMAKRRPMVPAKTRPVNLVLRSPWSARENPPQDLGYPVDSVNADEGQGSQTGTRKLVRTTQSPQVESYQVRREEKAQNSNPWKQDDTEVSSYSTGTGKLVRTATPRTEFQNMKYTNHQYMTKIFHFLPKKLERFLRRRVDCVKEQTHSRWPSIETCTCLKGSRAQRTFTRLFGRMGFSRSSWHSPRRGRFFCE